MPDTATLLLVHGAFCGDWVFWRLTPELDARGIAWVAADLPSCRSADARVGPHEDAAYVRALADEVGGPVVALGKSYGGAVISGALAGHPAVTHLVYVAASMPAAAEPFHATLGRALTPEFTSGISPLGDGRLVIDAEVGARHAFAHSDADAWAAWRRHASPFSMGPDPRTTFERVAWTDIPSTYLVCEQDEVLSPSTQREWAARATHVVTRPFDHSPGVSRPGEIADLVAEIARADVPRR